jgi:transposase, IS5 family
VLKARQLKAESGKQSRIDSTVIEANIRHPLDSQLLYDVVRVLTRLMKQAVDFSSRMLASTP